MLLERSEGNCDKGCIFSFDNGGMWTSHLKHLQITLAEAKGIIERWMDVDPKTMADYYALNGVTVAGIHYRLVRADYDVIHFSDKEKGKIVLQKTKKAIIAAHTPQGRNTETTFKAVASVADYITNHGY